MTLFSHDRNEALVAGASATATPEDLARAWFATLTRAWTTLAVVPVDSHVDAGPVAAALVAVGREHDAKPVQLLDARGATLSDVQRLAEDLAVARDSGDLIVVALDAVGTNPAALPIARATSAAVLLVRQTESRLAAVRQTARELGRERVIGSVVLR